MDNVNRNNKIYKIKNWGDYNRSLIKRGNITIWFNEESIKRWYAPKIKNSGAGRPNTYSDDCIKLALTIRCLFRFPLRLTQGFLEGMITMLGLELDVPDYSRFSRRAKGLDISLLYKKSSNAVDIVVDSTGLKIYGEGEWKVRIHGYGKRRTWRKLHVCVDPESHQTLSMEITPSTRTDGDVLPKMLKILNKRTKVSIGDVYGDGAYPGSALEKRPLIGIQKRPVAGQEKHYLSLLFFASAEAASFNL